MKRRSYAFFLTLQFLMVVLASPPAFAILGETADSIPADQKALSAAKRAVKRGACFTVHEIVADSTTVREYVAPSGIIFGVAWNGLVHPDLSQLLGKYAAQYREASRQAPRQPGRRSARVNTDGVVVEKWGHMRNLQGRAFVPALIPSGVTTDEIK